MSEVYALFRHPRERGEPRKPSKGLDSRFRGNDTDQQRPADRHFVRRTPMPSRAHYKRSSLVRITRWSPGP
jgi:hypothetical protein